MQSWQILIVAVGVSIVFNRWLIKRNARKTIHTQQKVYGSKHEFEARAPETIRDLDHAAYTQFRTCLEARHFLWLADIEDITLSRTYPSARSILRLMISAGGTVMATGFHFKVRGLMKLLIKLAGVSSSQFCTDLETEFSDGTFLCTGNSMLAARTKEFAGVRRVFLQTDSVDALLATHLRHLEQVIAADAALQPLEIHTLADFQASQERMQDLKNRAKAARGYIDAEEIANMANPGQEAAAERLGAEIEKIKRKDEKA